MREHIEACKAMVAALPTVTDAPKRQVRVCQVRERIVDAASAKSHLFQNLLQASAAEQLGKIRTGHRVDELVGAFAVSGQPVAGAHAALYARLRG